jgi:hypothetical protein
MDEKLKDMDVLPVREKGSNELKIAGKDGMFAPAIHLIRNKPDLESPYFGVRFTEEDRQNLQKTGNLGRIIEPEYPNGKMPVYLSVDRLTNELVAIKAGSVKKHFAAGN